MEIQLLLTVHNTHMLLDQQVLPKLLHETKMTLPWACQLCKMLSLIHTEVTEPVPSGQ